MNIGSLEYVVIGVQDQHFTREILPELLALQENDLIRVVDLLFVRKAADGAFTIQEIDEFVNEKQHPYTDLADVRIGLLTARDIEHLAEQVPPGTLAVIVLLEHTWTLSLADAVRRADGVLLSGGIVHPEMMKQVSEELATQEEHYA